MSIFGSVILAIGILGMLSEGEPVGALFFGIFSLVVWYLMAVFVTTTTRVAADEDALVVRTGPLWFPVRDDKILSRHDIVRVFYEQSIEAMGGGIPAHNVYAELTDGSKIPVVTSLPREYAVYIGRALDERLHAEDEQVEVIAPGDEFNADAEEDQIAYLLDSDAEEESRDAKR
jgi:hypothetical protein